MRIVIDLQGAQNGSQYRGIGRYTLALTKGIIKNNRHHEIIIAINEAFPETISVIREIFEGILPQENIRLWASPDLVSHCNNKNDWRRQAAEMLREAFLLSLNPDLVLISSLFEGAGDNVVTSIGNFTDKIPYAVILYDLIPFLNKDVYLANDKREKWYSEKLDYLTKAVVCLAISESSRQEAIKYLNFSTEKVCNISAASDEKFCKTSVHKDLQALIHKRWGINRPFVMYSGASDPRKNHIRLISAYAALPLFVRKAHQLVIAGGMPQDHMDAFKMHAQSAGLTADEVIITDRIDDEVMIGLYNLCKCFIFPTWHEGFGLPALEAMSCGAAVIGSNTSSVPEVIGNLEALFDPLNEVSITEKLNQVLTDQDFRENLSKQGLAQSKTFSWDITSKRALVALEHFASMSPNARSSFIEGELVISALIESIAGLKSNPQNKKCLLNLASCINSSFPNTSTEHNIMLQLKKSVRFSIKQRVLYVVSCIIKS